MVTVDESSIVKLKTHGAHFEIVVDSNAAIAFKEGKVADVREILTVPKVFSDARKGLEAPHTQMKQIFNTDDPVEVAKIILQKGEIPLTKEYRDQLREKKKKQIIDYIHRNAVDPQTHHPHPPQRIENAIEEAKVHISEVESVEHEVQEVLKKIRTILPLKFEMKDISVKIPTPYAHKSHQILRTFGKVLNENWMPDGSLQVLIEMPGGLEEDFYSKLSALCHGNVETEIIKIK